MFKSLYIHIPFCKKICGYCDFYKIRKNAELEKSYIEALFKEIEIKKLANYPFETLYLGGGSPSCLELENLGYLLNRLNKVLNLENLKEFTIEINPEDLSIDLIKLLKKYGINRISLGLQHSSCKVLTGLDRSYDKQKLIEDVQMLKEIGINNYSFDLLYGSIWENKNDLKETLDFYLTLDPKHISIYALTIYEATLFYKRSAKETLILDDDKVYNHYKFIKDYLEAHSLIQYEVSNFAKKGFESLHNLTYWKAESCAAIGASASESLYLNDEVIVRKNIANVKKYIELVGSSKYFEEIKYENFDYIEEYLMLALRLNEGIDLKEFKNRFKYNLCDLYDYEVLIRKNLLSLSEGHLKINDDYFFVQNQVITKLLLERRGES